MVEGDYCYCYEKNVFVVDEDDRKLNEPFRCGEDDHRKRCYYLNF